MKKLTTIVCIIFATVLSIGIFTACNRNDKFQVDIFHYDFSDQYGITVRDNMKSFFKQYDDINVTEYDAQGSQETQSTQVDNAIAKGSNLIVIALKEEGAVQSIINKAKEAGIPIILYNIDVDASALNSYDKAAFVGTDPDEAGYMQGELVASALMDESSPYYVDKDTVVNYVMLRGATNNIEADGRTEYSVKEANRLLEKYGYQPLNQLGADQDTDWNDAIATEQLSTLISSHGLGKPGTEDTINLVLCNSDQIASGALAALKAVGYNAVDNPTNYDNSVAVFGVDASETGKSNVDKGLMAGTVGQNAEKMANVVGQMCVNLKNDKEFLDSLDDYSFESGSRKIRIPYFKYPSNE